MIIRNSASRHSIRSDWASLRYPPRTDAFVGTGDGLQGTYYSQKDFTGEVLSRVDATVDFDWVEGSPVPGMTRNHFAVRWEGELQPQFSEPYALHVVSDDRARLWLDGELIVDEWHEHAESMSTAVANVEAGADTWCGWSTSRTVGRPARSCSGAVLPQRNRPFRKRNFTL